MRKFLYVNLVIIQVDSNTGCARHPVMSLADKQEEEL
jgi:hypothetical protein